MQFDVMIIGGGLVGASLALALRDSHLKIALIDSRLPSQSDPRLFALNATSCQLLKNIGVWSELEPHAAAIERIHVSRKGHFGAVRLDGHDLALPALGQVMPAYLIEKTMNHALSLLPNVTLYRPATLKSLVQQEKSVEVIVTTSEGDVTLEAAYVIGADGTASTVRRLINAKESTIDYDQCAIVTRTQLRRSHRHVAYERFNQIGAIAMLPLIGEECATIWSGDKVAIAALMALSDSEFLAALQSEFGYRLGKLQSISTRHMFPLQMVQAEKHVIGRVLLLGNAAHTLHPIAAQGFNLALYEVAVLADKLSRSLPIHLEEIDAQIYSQRKTSTMVSHQLASMFAHPSAAMSCLLQLGFIGLEMATPIKNLFMKKIIGRSGTVPRLLLSANE